MVIEVRSSFAVACREYPNEVVYLAQELVIGQDSNA